MYKINPYFPFVPHFLQEASSTFCLVPRWSPIHPDRPWIYNTGPAILIPVKLAQILCWPEGVINVLQGSSVQLLEGSGHCKGMRQPPNPITGMKRQLSCVNLKWLGLHPV